MKPIDIVKHIKPEYLVGGKDCLIYFLCDSLGDVIYIGKTAGLHQRLIDHKSRGMKYDRVSAISTPEITMSKLEKTLITIFRPEENKEKFQNRDKYRYAYSYQFLNEEFVDNYIEVFHVSYRAIKAEN